MTNHSLSSIQSRNLIVARQREPVRHIPRRWPVVLRRVVRCWIVAGVVLRTRMRVRRVEERMRESPSEIYHEGFVICIPVVVRIRDLTEALVQPRGNEAFILNQVAGESVDVNAVAYDT